MILFDSHCHLDDPCYDGDMDDVFARAHEAGVTAMTIAGVNVDTAHRAVRIAGERQNVITAVGLHPHESVNGTPETMAALTDLARSHACVKAWGETGLDFFRMLSPKKEQESCFAEQIDIARNLDLPLIFHERDSNGRFHEILTAETPAVTKGVVHCFSGTQKELFHYLDMGFYIGITGILTLLKRGEFLRELAPMIPENRLLVETDAPYLTPAPQKNKVRRNEPAFVRSVLLKLAEVRKTDPDDLSHVIFNNTQAFFNTGFTVSP